MVLRLLVVLRRHEMVLRRRHEMVLRRLPGPASSSSYPSARTHRREESRRRSRRHLLGERRMPLPLLDERRTNSPPPLLDERRTNSPLPLPPPPPPVLAGPDSPTATIARRRRESAPPAAAPPTRTTADRIGPTTTKLLPSTELLLMRRWPHADPGRQARQTSKAERQGESASRAEIAQAAPAG